MITLVTIKKKADSEHTPLFTQYVRDLYFVIDYILICFDGMNLVSSHLVSQFSHHCLAYGNELGFHRIY